MSSITPQQYPSEVVVVYHQMDDFNKTRQLGLRLRPDGRFLVNGLEKGFNLRVVMQYNIAEGFSTIIDVDPSSGFSLYPIFLAADGKFHITGDPVQQHSQFQITTIHQALDSHFSEITIARYHSSTCTTKSICDKYKDITKLELREWENFQDEVVKRKTEIPNDPLKTPFLAHEAIICASEADILSEARSSVFKYLTGVITSLSGHANFPHVSPGSFQASDGRTNVLGDPDRVWTPDGTNSAKLTVEFKSPWAIESLDNIIQRYEEEYTEFVSGTVKEKGKIIRALEQIYVYMTINRYRYGVLTNYNDTCFLKKIDVPTSPHRSVLWVSPVIKCSQRAPYTLMSAWIYLLLLIEQGTDWIYSSPHSSLVASPDVNVLREHSNRARRYTAKNLEGLTKWTGIITRSQAGAVAAGTYLNVQNVVFKTIDLTKRENALAQFDHEVSVYKELESLQGTVIPTLYAYGNIGGLLQVIVLENVGRCITSDEFQMRKDEVYEAIKKINDLGIMHGDLRLPNIMVDQENCIRIIDFGFSEKVGGPIVEYVNLRD
ncbi:hypothetical protein MP638_006392 [Amoeboaphelidium occidentale]|nr:hypothetical protein MP638_006392 [Amoeboaphelidium occidentale]